MIKDIDLCGIGNGLLDIQVEVGFSEIDELKLSKGEMRLVDSQQQTSIINRLDSREQKISSGGSAANTIIAFSRFGGKGAYFTSLGDDEFGRFYSEEFHSFGINLIPNFHKGIPTGTCLVLITPDSERTMNTCLSASALFDRNNINEEMISRSKWLYIEGYQLADEISADAIFHACSVAKKYNTKIAVTFSDVFITNHFYENLRKVISFADFLFCNEAEAKNYTKTRNSDDALNELTRICSSVALTKGSNGSVIVYNNKQFSVEAFPINAIDSTGAGDMFAGGFLYGLICENDIVFAARLGSYAASIVVSRFGARLDEDYPKIVKFVRSF